MIFVCVCGFDLISVVVHYISVVIFSMENSSNSTTTTTITTSNPGTTTHDSILDNGPNNVSCVVWAHSEFFNFSFHVFFILNIMDSYHWSIEVMEGLREDGDKENGPKRWVLCRLGHSVNFFFFSHHVFYILTIIEKLQRLWLYGGTVSIL